MKRIYIRLICAVLALVALAPGYAQESTTFVYDALGRLVSVSRSGGPNNGAQATYGLDAAGNRTQVTTTAPVSSTSLSIAGGSAAEGSPVVFTVTRSGSTASTSNVNFATADGSATAGADYGATSGTLTFAAGETSKTISVATYTDMLTEGNETFSITLSSPSGATIGTASATGTITDVAPPGLSIASASANEGSAIAFTVTRSGSSSAAVTVNYATADGSAQAGADYTATSGTLSFAAGETSKTISVPTASDAYVEGNETFSINLSSASGASITTGSATGTIVDVVPASSLSIGDASASEGSAVTFTVTRNSSTAMYVTVNYATSDGSAAAGSDYTAISGSLTFAPGETSKTVSVSTNTDAYVEGNETFAINLSGPTGGASLAQGGATGTIIDYVPASSMSVSDASANEGSALTFTVTRDGSSMMYSNVNYSTSDGSANAGSDYNAVSGTLNFAPGETSKTISVQALNDTINEGNENFYFNLSSAFGTSVGRGQGVGTIANVFYNHPPVAGSTINVYVQPCQTTYTNVITGSSDPDGDTVTLVNVSSLSSYGSVSVADNSTVQYAPNGGRGGTENAFYIIQDSHGAQATGTIVYHVNTVSDTCDPPIE